MDVLVATVHFKRWITILHAFRLTDIIGVVDFSVADYEEKSKRNADACRPTHLHVY